MTIAACHVSPEGVVLGADSATTVFVGGALQCHFDYAQKLFEVGEPESLVGLVTWGMGRIGSSSHRTVAAELGRQHAASPFKSMKEMAEALGGAVWTRYSEAHPEELALGQSLREKLKKDGNLPDEEWVQINTLLGGYSGGYCLGGRASDNEAGQAWQILWSPIQETSDIVALKPEDATFWGVPQIMQRLIFGFDQDALAKILASGHWKADPSVLYDLIAEQQLIQPSLLPIREAIDWIHTVIHTTIRGTKFAKWPHFCGGPVEIAVITNDRPFRWVRHKEMSAAILSP